MVDLLGGGQGALQVPLCFTEGAEGGVGVGAAGETEAQAGDVSGSFVAGDEPLIQAERSLRTVGQQKSVPDQRFPRWPRRSPRWPRRSSATWRWAAPE